MGSIFTPPSSEQIAAARHVKDLKAAGDEIMSCKIVQVFASGRISALIVIEQWLQVQRLPIDTNWATALEQSRLSEQAVKDASAVYQENVEGWIGGIMEIRDIASRTAPITPELQARLAFPAMPQVVSDYITVNKLS
jgi:hypothetical protein